MSKAGTKLVYSPSWPNFIDKSITKEHFLVLLELSNLLKNFPWIMIVAHKRGPNCALFGESDDFSSKKTAH